MFVGYPTSEITQDLYYLFVIAFVWRRGWDSMPLGRAEGEGRATEASLSDHERDECRVSGGEGGIRTHVPLRTTRFRGAPVTTTSVPLRSEWTVPIAGTSKY